MKKVYADYHSMRYTRKHDGRLGQWKYAGTAMRSKVPDRSINRNPDLTDEDGRHEMSGIARPIAGMQSVRDPDYVEYMVLSAKTAKIDGFMLEWGFPEHTADSDLKVLLKTAEQYNFEVGINWCDAWHFYDWIRQAHDDIRKREDILPYFKASLEYLLDNVYAKENSIRFDGRPLIFIFGGGLRENELKDVKKFISESIEKNGQPLLLARAPIWGELSKTDVQYETTADTEYYKQFDGFFPWIPTRLRSGEGRAYKHWDRYADQKDCINYLRQAMALQISKNIKTAPLIGGVCPEMDNRGCASWGKHDLSYIPRNHGATYQAMWEENLRHKDELDLIFITSWNDFTENHQIEASYEHGFRELFTTEKYAADFKSLPSDPEGIELPLKLFKLRKEAEVYKILGFAAESFSAELDKIGTAISHGCYQEAKHGIMQAEETIKKRKAETKSFPVCTELKSCQNRNAHETFTVYSIPETSSLPLEKAAAELYLEFTYKDAPGELIVSAPSRREDCEDGDFSVICSLTRSGSGEFKKARVRIYPENTDFKENPLLLKFTDRAENIKDVKLTGEIRRRL